MATLERRVEALEFSGAGGFDDFVLLVSFVGPGRLEAPLLLATIDDEPFEIWPHEPEQDFKERLTRTVRERFPAGKRPLVFLSETAW